MDVNVTNHTIMDDPNAELPHHYNYIPGDVLQFVTSNRLVVVFGRLNPNTPILQLAAEGMEIYKKTIRRCAPQYDSISSKAEKKQYSSSVVTKLINKGVLFIEKKGDNYFEYNMDTTEAFDKIREKVRQAMMDFLRKTTLPEISIPLLSGDDLIHVFDLKPRIGHAMNNMNVLSQEGEFDDMDPCDVLMLQIEGMNAMNSI